MKRSKSNLIQAIPKPPEPVILGAEERRAYLGMIHLWRCFDLWFTGLVGMGA